ncbi:hypothetical protein [Paraburkholderia sp. BR13444]|uniref:hypothetical protein n=1 Tax=Paraburkholderia TaxID=1822464 RepID=UPI0034CDF4DF
MNNKKRLLPVPLVVLVPLAVHAQTPPDFAAGARTNAEQQQQVEQQRDAGGEWQLALHRLCGMKLVAKLI